VEPAAAVSTRRTRLRTAMSQFGAVVVLAVASACTSPEPAAVLRPGGPYIATRPEAFEGRVIGKGYCVDFVTAAAGVPRTALWQEGVEVRGNHHIEPGTAIATFESDGSYTSESGNHAAIYLSQDDDGIWVYDQWQGQPEAPDPLRGRGRCQVGQQEQRRQALRRDRVGYPPRRGAGSSSRSPIPRHARRGSSIYTGLGGDLVDVTQANHPIAGFPYRILWHTAIEATTCSAECVCALRATPVPACPSPAAWGSRWSGITILRARPRFAAQGTRRVTDQPPAD
jgi:hypothetical protein